MKIFSVISLILMFITISNAQWQKQNIETKASLRGLSVVDENVIWASGTLGTVLRTVDGGKNWSVIEVPKAEKLDFRDIEAFDANTAYILSIGTGEASRIYKTIDGGKTWKLQFLNDNKNAFFDAIAFWDSKNGIAMSDPVNGAYLFYTTIDGENWEPLGRNPTNKRTLVLAQAEEGEAAFAASGTCLITSGANDAFIVSGGKNARVFHSTDRGFSWKPIQTPIIRGTAGSGIFSIAMSDTKKGVIVGGNYEKPEEINDNLAFTSDGGKSWKLAKGLTGYRSGVTYVDKKTLIAVGTNGSDLSVNGGTSWKNLDRENYNSVQSKGKNVIWAVGASGLVARFKFSEK